MENTLTGARRDAATLKKIGEAGVATKILLKGASVVSMDDGVGDLLEGDILIEGNRIAAVAPSIEEAGADGQAIVVDATDTIAIPGLQDTHRHSWQSQFRRLLPDIDLIEYMGLVHMKIAPGYRPEDVYVGNHLAAIAALDSGITTVLDYFHNYRSSEHADEGLRAWREAGIRAVVAYGAPAVAAEWGAGWQRDLLRLRAEELSDDAALVTMRLGVVPNIGPIVSPDMELSAETLRLAEQLEVGVTVDAVFGATASEQLEQLSRAGLLHSDMTYIHCQSLSDGAWRAISESGGAIALAATSDAQLLCEGSVPPIQEALDHGLAPSLSIDVECCLTSDMFTQMQLVLNVQRMLVGRARHRGKDGGATPIKARDALAYATVNGAGANGVGSRTGTLAPGMEADLVLIRKLDANNLPLNNAVGTVVLGTDAGNVDTVFVAGRPRKWAGDLVGIDLAAANEIAVDSRDRLLAEAGYELEVMG